MLYRESIMESMDIGENELQTHTIQARFVSDTGEEAGPPIDLPIQVDLTQLELICNALLKNVSKNILNSCKSPY
jgi:NLE (NUC135) domain